MLKQGMTQPEIVVALGLTRQRVNQLVKAVARKRNP